MSKSRLAHQRDERLAKINQLKSLGIDPYPAQSKKDHPNKFVVENFDSLESKDIFVTGRVMSLREHGKVAFADIADQSGNLQLFIRADIQQQTNKESQTIGFENLNLIDPGDFVEAFGEVTKTKTGQVSIMVKSLKLLTKSLRPLPSTREEITDHEFKFRRRYLDLTLNPKTRELFERKAKFWSANRTFLQNNGFIEVETPVLEHVTGGADARPFTTYMNALDQNFFLRISTELYQKRLIGGGFEKIFTVGPNFRNEGLSDEHLTEYTQIEWYWAYADYENNMNLVENMFKHIAQSVYGKTEFTTRGHTFDLNNSWERISYPDVIKEKLGVDIFEDSEDKMLSIIKEHKVELGGAINRNRLIDNLWKIIRKTISGPAFLINEPAFMSPLSKSKLSDPRLTERFHVIIAGSELGNGYSELNDPLDQLNRFMEQQAQREAGDDEAQMMDIDFVEMLEYGMPPTSGYGHSERVFWFLENVTAREGTLFPALRYKLEKTTAQIYGIKAPLIENELEAVDTDYDEKNIEESENSKLEELAIHEVERVQEINSTTFSRDKALELVREFVKNENLIKHMLAVESAMEFYANKFINEGKLQTEDKDATIEQWRVAGLLHDFDWEIHPSLEQHPQNGSAILRERGVDEFMIQTILSHADHSGINRDSLIQKALYACDEITGLITTTALVRPDKKLESVELSSIKKKWKNKSFAAGVKREDVENGARDLGIELWEHIQNVLTAMQAISHELGL